MSGSTETDLRNQLIAITTELGLVNIQNTNLKLQNKMLYETLKNVQRHGLIEKDGYESVLRNMHFALSTTEATLK